MLNSLEIPLTRQALTDRVIAKVHIADFISDMHDRDSIVTVVKIIA